MILAASYNSAYDDGFGLVRFKKQLSGPQYAERFIEKLKASDVSLLLDTTVLSIENKVIRAVSPREGVLEIRPGAIVLAMGCRERTRSQVEIYGTRPSGVMTAGTVQRYINLEGYLPGRRAVILGSGDIGMIMARRMHLEGIEVLGVYELMPEVGGLARNVYQCLIDYDIPLHLSTTVREVFGKERLEGVRVVKVDKNRRPIEGTEEDIACDLLVLSVGLIPENELSRKAGVLISPVTQGPVLDESMMTSVRVSLRRQCLDRFRFSRLRLRQCGSRCARRRSLSRRTSSLRGTARRDLRE